MPYIPFPKTWPVYSPAPKLSAWLKSYAESMELNVWTSTNIESLSYDESSKLWTVTLVRSGKSEGDDEKAYGKRVLKVKRVVWAIGIASGVPNIPKFKGEEVFKGKIVHSFDHVTARDYIGKKALIVGACTSGEIVLFLLAIILNSHSAAHDIAADFYHYKVPVTIHQRSPTYIMTTKAGWQVSFAGTYEEGGPPTHVADLMIQSMPRYAAKGIEVRATKIIKELDKELLKGLEDVGFQLTDGIDGSGFPQLAWNKAGGYYLGQSEPDLFLRLDCPMVYQMLVLPL